MAMWLTLSIIIISFKKTHENIMNKQMVLLFLIIAMFITSCQHKQIADVTIDCVSKELTKATKSYDNLGAFHQGLAKVGRDNKYGFIDKLGHEIITCQYDEVSDFQYGVSIVKNKGKVGLIDRTGEFIVPCKFDCINYFGKDSLASISIKDKFGLIDLNGNIAIPIEYEEIGNFSEGLAPVRLNGQYGFINRSGELIIPCAYDELYNGIGFNEGLAGVNKDGKWGYIDTTGNIAIPFKDGLTGAPFSSGLSTICRGGISFYIDSYGNIVSKDKPFEMAFINSHGDLASDYLIVKDLQGFRNGYSTITDQNGWEGLINTQGEFIIPCEYSFIANGFDDNFVLIQLNHKSGFARKSTGDIVIPCIYEIDYNGWQFREGLVPVKKNGKYGYINENNEIIIPFVYDSASQFSEGFAIVEKFGKPGFVDRYGVDTFEHL